MAMANLSTLLASLSPLVTPKLSPSTAVVLDNERSSCRCLMLLDAKRKRDGDGNNNKLYDIGQLQPPSDTNKHPSRAMRLQRREVRFILDVVCRGFVWEALFGCSDCDCLRQSQVRACLKINAAPNCLRDFVRNDAYERKALRVPLHEQLLLFLEKEATAARRQL